jgi:uncharacterized membrane protein
MTRRVHLLPGLAVAVAVHLATVWAYPSLVMAMLARQAPAPSNPADPGNRVYLPPTTDHTQRRIVMPSPDLLYATCSVDLRQGPWRVTADPKNDRYWSIAFYGANSDNWFVLNDRQAGGAPVDLLLLPPGGVPPAGTTARVLVAPQSRGLLLMRLLVGGDAASRQAAETARRTLRCGPA